MTSKAAYLIAVAALVIVAPPTARAAGLDDEKSEESKTAVEYDLRDLLRGPRDVFDYFPPLRPLLLPQIPGGIGFDERVELQTLGDFEESYLSPTAAPEQIIEAVEELLERAAGEEADEVELGGSLRLVDGILRAELSPAAHDVLRGVLAEIRHGTGTTILVECVLLSLEDWTRIVSEDEPDPTSVDDAVFDQALLLRGSQYLTVECFERQHRTTGPMTQDVAIRDYEVNQTGVIPVVNPVLDSLVSGARLAARAFSAGGDGRIVVDVWVGKFSAQSEKSHELGGTLGSVTLPVRKETQLFTTVVCGKGAVRAGRIGGENGAIALVRAGKTGPDADPVTSDRQVSGGLYRVYPAALLLRDPIGRKLHEKRSRDMGAISFGGGDEEDDITTDSPWDEERLQLALEDRFGDEKLETLDPSFTILGGRAIAVLGPPEVHEFIQSLIAAELDRRCRRATIDVEALELPRDAYVELRRRSTSGMLLPTDWEISLADREDVRRTGYSVAGTTNEVHLLRGATIESFVLDVELVSGGTGFAIIDVADPVTDTAGTGAELRVAVSLDSYGKAARLQLEGTQARITARRSVESRYPMVSGAQQQASGGRANVISSTLQLYVPSQESVRWSATRRLPVGRWALLQAESGPRDKIRVLVGRVRTDS